jgi:predicted cupin superfamily sugar epimerase
MQYNDLIDHPEGGRFQEIYRSATQIQTATRDTKTALTHIYFSLNGDEVSRFHRVASDEVWNLYQGNGLILYQWNGKVSARGAKIERIELSAQGMNFCHVIPAGYWQAAEPLGDRVLVGCSVAPGFEYADFELIDPTSEAAQHILMADPAFERLVMPK